MNKSESKYFNTAKKMNLALIDLLQKKPFEYITVSELCKTAGVNRSTFYLHYETIDDLLKESTRLLLDDFLAYFTPNTQQVAFNLSDCRLDELFFICDEYLTPYLSYIKENKDVFLTALKHIKSFNFYDVYKRMFTSIFQPILNRFDYPEDMQSYVMMYYLNGINAITMEWLKNDCDKSIREISAIITTCIYGKNRTQDDF